MTVDTGRPFPDDEDVVGRLHQSLPDDDSLTVIGVLALPDKEFQHRFRGFFRLQKEWILTIASEHQQDPGTRADAADADHFAGAWT